MKPFQTLRLKKIVYSDDPERINPTQMWKTLQKLWPKCGTTLPTANNNHKG